MMISAIAAMSSPLPPPTAQLSVFSSSDPHVSFHFLLLSPAKTGRIKTDVKIAECTRIYMEDFLGSKTLL